MGKSTISMVIFYSYVSLPEGIRWWNITESNLQRLAVPMEVWLSWFRPRFWDRCCCPFTNVLAKSSPTGRGLDTDWLWRGYRKWDDCTSQRFINQELHVSIHNLCLLWILYYSIFILYNIIFNIYILYLLYYVTLYYIIFAYTYRIL